MALSISDKGDFRAKKITRDREQQYIIKKRSSYNRDIVIKKLHTWNNHTFKIYDEKIDITERGNRELFNYSWWFQYSSLKNHTGNQQGYTITDQYHEPPRI